MESDCGFRLADCSHERDAPASSRRQRQPDRHEDRDTHACARGLRGAHQRAEDRHAECGAALPARIECASRDARTTLLDGAHHRGRDGRLQRRLAAVAAGGCRLRSNCCFRLRVSVSIYPIRSSNRQSTIA